jgi:hypothetical protein
MAIGQDNASVERLKHDLSGAVRKVQAEFERIEILVAALYGFSSPVPDYEPTFRHVAPAQLNCHELGGTDARND